MKRNASGRSSVYPFFKALSPAQKKLFVRPRHKQVHVAAGRIRSRAAGILTEGLGANLPRIDQPGQEQCYPQSEADWLKLEQHLNWLGLAWIRYWLFGDKVIPEPGTFHADHDYLQRLVRLHRWAEARDARLILDFGVTPEWLRFETDNARARRFSAPADIGRYIEDYALPLVRHVKRGLGLKQVRYLSVFNEPFCPDGPDPRVFSFFVPRGIDVFAYYVELFARLRRRLDEEGIPESELALIGPNSHDLYLQPLAEMKKRRLDLLPHVGAVDEHCYRIRFDYLPPVRHIPTLTIGETIRRYLAPAVRTAQRAKKGYFLTEYSTFYYGGITGDPQGPARHEAVLTEIEFVIRSLAAGVNGAMKWAFLNSGQADGLWQYIQTMDGSYAPVPTVYFGNAVLTRFTPRGGAVHPVVFGGKAARHLHAVCVRSGGNATLLMVNDHPAEQVRVEFDRRQLPSGKPWTMRFTDSVARFRSGEADDDGRAVRVLLNPLSVCALTTFRLDDDGPGLI